MTRFVSSTVQAIHNDMMELGCHPLVVNLVCEQMEKQPGPYQLIFLDRVEGMEIKEIAEDIGMWRESVSRIIHHKLNCIASLLDATSIT